VRQKLIEKLIFVRERAGLNRKELSHKINRGVNFISKVEKGKTPISLDDLDKIIEICDSSLEEFFYDKFESYGVDKEILHRLNEISPESKDVVLSLLAMLYHHKKDDIGDVV